MKQLLHTPEGVRDIYNSECQKKITLQEQMHAVLHTYGYQDIQTPMFEYFDVFRKEVGTIPSKELYKFFDREGNTLVLRPDFTPSIARAAATLFDTENLPVRLSYIGNTFINHSSYQGRLKENTQLGAECIGLDSIEADAEMIALAVDCMKKAGLKEFQITIGNVDFLQSLLEEMKLPEAEEEKVRELINNRNYFGVDELLDHLAVKTSSREAFLMLPELIGGVDVLKQAEEIAPGTKARKAINRLLGIYDILEVYGVEEYVTFDLSMSGTYGYYTGIIFRGYTFGTGDAIVKGGRYDHLLEKFGKECPSIGFAIVIDEIMNALSRQKIEIPLRYEGTLVLYDEGRKKDAIKLAKEFRGHQRNTELLYREKARTIDEYSAYGKRNFAGSMLYMQDTGEIFIRNLRNGEEKVVKSQS